MSDDNDVHASRPVWWIGVDPGLHGAFAMLDHRGAIAGRHVVDNPVVAGGKGARDQHNVVVISKLFALMREDARSAGAEPRVALENVHSMPAQGVASTFSFGMGFGLWLALCAETRTPCQRINPQDWKAVTMRGRSRKDPKQMAVVVALERWPNAPIRGKKDHGVADALLIAEAVRLLVSARGERPVAIA